MRILILNWSDGENDPFTYFSQQLQRQLDVLGHEVHIVPVNDLMAATIHAIHVAAHVDLVFAWQGIGSATHLSNGQSLWAQLELPLVCLHGDHPCYNPTNHQQPSAHVLHVYCTPAFSRDANRLIPRDWPALFEGHPNFFVAADASPNFEGEFFVFPKNFTDPIDIRRGWKERCTDATYRLLCAGADAIASAYRNGNRADHHELILDALEAPIPEFVRTGRVDGGIANLVFAIGRELDQVHRNVAAEFVLESLPDVPIRVYGRGWDRFAARGNTNHSFLPFDRMAQGDWQYESAFGIIDIGPHNGMLHDRTLRAMRKGAGLLISSAWRRDEPIHTDSSDLFFSGDAGELRAKVELVRTDPDAHRARVRTFAAAYDRAFPMSDFLMRIRGHAAGRGFLLPQ